ncbi:MAG: acylneuraminate cytidylyltransferase [Legionellales bacterium]|nr:acylneuraminate cytidylyltransferase [Legionellales bacterium]
MKKIHCIILARGGSKGLPRKNLADFCGKPLLQWTIDQALAANNVSTVWVSSDNKEIIDLSSSLGAKTILRPDEFSNDISTSESAWLHAINYIDQNVSEDINFVLAPQCTSPIRESKDFDEAIKKYFDEKLDSLFSGSLATDFNLWRYNTNKELFSHTYDYTRRGRRQEKPEQIVENGSFYIFKTELLKKENNRLGGKIGVHIMEFWKSFQIDELDDLEFCENLMKNYLG